ncbi:hypothetical protein STEG23_013647, partial [Scotinomys teguina]
MIYTVLSGSSVSSIWRATRSSLLTHLRKASYGEGKSELGKQPLKKSKLPVGRFDAPEDSHLEKEPLKKGYPMDCLVFLTLLLSEALCTQSSMLSPVPAYCRRKMNKIPDGSCSDASDLDSIPETIRHINHLKADNKSIKRRCPKRKRKL